MLKIRELYNRKKDLKVFLMGLDEDSPCREWYVNEMISVTEELNTLLGIPSAPTTGQLRCEFEIPSAPTKRPLMFEFEMDLGNDKKF
jgi:hypothetical protein